MFPSLINTWINSLSGIFSWCYHLSHPTPKVVPSPEKPKGLNNRKVSFCKDHRRYSYDENEPSSESCSISVLPCKKPKRKNSRPSTDINTLSTSHLEALKIVQSQQNSYSFRTSYQQRQH